jgi:hypothetical protein
VLDGRSARHVRERAGVRALAVQLEARGNALTGDGDDANRKLDEAASLMERAAGYPRNEIEPPWIISFRPAYLELQRGLAFARTAKSSAGAAFRAMADPSRRGRPRRANEINSGSHGGVEKVTVR